MGPPAVPEMVITPEPVEIMFTDPDIMNTP